LRCGLLPDIDAVFSVFSEVIALLDGYIVLIFVARWRYNFPEIAVKNCENPRNRRKSLCAPLRTDSFEKLQ